MWYERPFRVLLWIAFLKYFRSTLHLFVAKTYENMFDETTDENFLENLIHRALY